MDDESLGRELPASHREGAFEVALDRHLRRPRLRCEGDRDELDFTALLQFRGEVLHRVHETDAGEGLAEIAGVVQRVLAHRFAALVDDCVTGREIDRVAALHFRPRPLLPAPAQLGEVGMLPQHRLLLHEAAAVELVRRRHVQVVVLDPLRQRSGRDLLSRGVAHHREPSQRALGPVQGNRARRGRSAQSARSEDC